MRNHSIQGSALSGRHAAVVGRSTVAGKPAAPVPGGVGPVTTALLLQHTVHAAGRS